MQPLRQLTPERTLDIIVDAQIFFHQVSELSQYLIWVLIKQSLQFAHLLVIIEILLIFCIKLREHAKVML